VDPRDGLGRARVAGVGLTDGIPRPKLVSMESVLVLNSNCCPIERLSGPLAVAVEPMSVAVSKAETLSRPVSGRDGMSRVDSHSAVEGLSGPLAIAVESMSIAISKAKTLNRPMSGRDGVSRVDSHSAVEGLSGPLAVVATVVEARVKTRDLLVRSTEAGVGLADGVLGGVLVSVDVVAVLKSGDGTVVSVGISAPLAVAGVELSPLLERSGSTGVRLADSVAGGQLMSVHIVTVLQGGGEGDVGNSVADSVSVRSISAPLANTVSVGSVSGGAGTVAVAGGRPGAETACGELVTVEGFG